VTLRIEALAVELGRRTVLDRISLEVERGRWAALIGPNGAGKTTLLRAIAGLVSHCGTVLLDGADGAGLSRRERARRVAVVPQDPVVPPAISVRDYVLLGRTPHVGYFGVERDRDRRAADRALARLGLEAFAKRWMGTLSGGERQRVVLARALAQEARILLLDEPTSALDLARQQQVLELVDRLRRDEGLTVVTAMHDLTLAASYADQVHLLSEGRLVASGAPAEVLRSRLLGEHFGATVRVFDHDGQIVVMPFRERVTA
jgi:iron complex transport system ATP-binding protein